MYSSQRVWVFKALGASFPRFTGSDSKALMKVFCSLLVSEHTGRGTAASTAHVSENKKHGLHRADVRRSWRRDHLQDDYCVLLDFQYTAEHTLKGTQRRQRVPMNDSGNGHGQGTMSPAANIERKLQQDSSDVQT